MWPVAAVLNNVVLKGEGARLLSVPVVPCPWETQFSSLPKSRGKEGDGEGDEGSSTSPESSS